MKTKVCTKCKKELPSTSEYFAANKRLKSGLRGICKECERQYRFENKERTAEYDRQYRFENKDRIAERKRKYYKQNKDRLAERNRRYYENNKECFKQYSGRYYENNKTRLLEYGSEYGRKYRRDNKERIRLHVQKRLARKRSLPNTLTTKEWQESVGAFEGCCAYCGRKAKLTQDHFWPLSRGGGYTATNIIPACKSCNSSKRDKLFEEWYPTYENYSPEREAKIYEYFEQLALENGEQGRQLIKQKNEVEGDR